MSGCAAGRASYFLVDATRAYKDAVDAGAVERAPYEITLAKEYLAKAREEDGYSDYGAAERLSKRSIEASQRAVVRAGQQDILPDAKNVPEQHEKKPVAPPDQAPPINLDEP